MKLAIEKLSLISALLLAFSFILYDSSLAVEEKNSVSPEVVPNEYPDIFVGSYINQCTELAGVDLPQEDAHNLCKCTLKNFQARYSYEQYKELSQETKEDIGLSCFEKVLYPDE